MRRTKKAAAATTRRSYSTQLSALDRKEQSAPSGADASSRPGAFGGSCGREQAIAVGCLLCTRGRIWGRVLTRCSLGGPVPIQFFSIFFFFATQFFSICPTSMRAEEMEEESHKPLLLSSFMGRHLLTVVSASLLGPICNSAAWDQIAWCP